MDKIFRIAKGLNIICSQSQIQENMMDALYALQKIFSNTYISLALLSVLVGCLGIVGNILCVIVLSRRNMRSNSINLLLMCLSFWDIVTIIGISGSAGFFATFSYLFTEDESFSDHCQSQIRFYLVCYALGETGNFVIC